MKETSEKETALDRQRREKAEYLVKQMTLEEKVSQTMNQAPAIERLGIKAYNWWNEGLHGVARAGVATIFPQAIGLAATFDEDLIETVGEAVSTEARAKYHMQQRYGDTDIYKGLTLWAPNINIFRDPRWGRGHETYGEDPWLTSRLGIRYIRGLQGSHEKYLKTAACVKHFAVHSGPEELRHSFDAEVSEKDLRETYLPAFEACVKDGDVEAVMGAYNRVNGVPCCGNEYLLETILRKEWGFHGHVVSDCWAIKDFHEGHGVTDSPVESVSMAMNHGCDLNCGNLFTYLIQAVKEGKVKEERLDEAVIRLLTTRLKLGALGKMEEDDPYAGISYLEVDSPAMKKLNRSAAGKSVVLLKNTEGLLPIDTKRYKTIGVIGPNADSRRALVGNYEGTASEYVTVLEGIREAAEPEARVLYSEGCHLYKSNVSGLGARNDRLSEVKGICRESDIVIACMGLDSTLEGEQGDTGNIYAGGDKPDLMLPGLQQKILETAYDSGKPVVLVLLAGSAMAVSWADEHLPAILTAWYPGAEGGRGVADVLFGTVNPEGRLPVTFYRTTEELPDFTDYSMEGRTYRFMKQKALYPFGFGLSYTEFSCSGLEVSERDSVDNGVEVKLCVANCGERWGRETIQVYVGRKEDHDRNPQLKAAVKVGLEPGEEKTISIHLPADAFAVYDENGKRYIDACTYQIFAGGSQPDQRSAELKKQRVLCAEVRSVRKYCIDETI